MPEKKEDEIEKMLNKIHEKCSIYYQKIMQNKVIMILLIMILLLLPLFRPMVEKAADKWYAEMREEVQKED